MEIEQPNWNLLPHDARQFFDLKAKFDRKDLKRAYGKLIRRFKPEKFPEEFQRIRAAFESLDRQLRYGQITPAKSPQDGYQWNPNRSPHAPDSTASDSTASDSTASDSATSDSTGVADSSVADSSDADSRAPDRSDTDSPHKNRRVKLPFHERLKKEKPAALYSEIKRVEHKTPYDFFALAILSDVVTPDENVFLKWLLMGLKQHPHDQGLFSLLHQHLQTEISIDALPQLLVAVSKVVKDDRYYYLTERAWERLLRESQFDVFQSTLERCESNLKDFRNRARIAFYVQTLRHALWKGNRAWLQTKFQWLESHVDHLSPQLEMDFQILDLIRDYQRTAKSFVGQNPKRQLVALAIRDYFSLETAAADARIIECQLNLAGDAEALLNAFPAEIPETESAAANAMWALWHVIASDVAERSGIEATSVAPQKFTERVFALMADLDTTWRISQTQIWMYDGLKYFIFFPTIILLAGVVLGVTAGIFGDNLFLILFFTGITMSAFATLHFRLVVPRWIEPYVRRRITNTIRKQYVQLWRGRFIQLLDANHASMRDLSGALYEIVINQKTNLNAAAHLIHFVPADMGIAIYSEAARFRV